VVTPPQLHRGLGHDPVPGDKAHWIINMMDKLGSDPASSNYVRPTTGDVWGFARTAYRVDRKSFQERYSVTYLSRPFALAIIQVD
jgi:hypothetical protein